MASTEQIETFWMGWAAGFFDGEGYIGLAKRHRRNSVNYDLRITATNTDIRALHRFKQMFGGSVQVQVKPNHKRWLPSWTWVAQNINAEQCLLRLLPWLVVKREQAELAIRSRQYVDRRHRHQKTTMELDNLEWMKQELSRLKVPSYVHAETPGQRNHSDEQERLLWPT